MAEPVRALQTFLAPTLTLGPIEVKFADHNLWRPRYQSLIKEVFYTPGFLPLQFEPSFQVCSEDPDQEVKVFFQIPESENAVFDAGPGGLVSSQSLTLSGQPPPAPDVTVTLVDENPRLCCVTWRRSGEIPTWAHLTALRIVCRPILGEPSRENDDWEALTRVEGGVYLVIIDRGASRPNPDSAQNSAAPVSGRIQVLGIDANSRPVYDLFDDTFIVPQGIALEPAFRAPHGASLELPLALNLPPQYGAARFKTDGDGQVEMSYVMPDSRPGNLKGAHSPDGLLCTLEWSRPSQGSCKLDPSTDACTQGRTANFLVQLDPGDGGPSVSVDPTVIEPPPCDASGVCTKPRDRGEDS